MEGTPALRGIGRSIHRGNTLPDWDFRKTLGQLHKENQLFSPFSDQAFEIRLTDLLRNAKNYSIIMNTLLRKAAENGGVHPVYLDHVSSEFAARIEQMRERMESAGLMREMFRTYCRLVRKHAMMHFSLVVQKVILLIESDLSANLTLTALAQHQNVSPGYLSTIFKKDTGKDVLRQAGSRQTAVNGVPKRYSST